MHFCSYKCNVGITTLGTQILVLFVSKYLLGKDLLPNHFYTVILLGIISDLEILNEIYHHQPLLPFSLQTTDIIEYLQRLSKTTVPDGIVQFIKVYFLSSQLVCRTQFMISKEQDAAGY